MTTENKLRCNFNVQPYPYPGDAEASLVGWGELSLSLLTSSDNVLLFNWEWDLLAFAEWFAQNQTALCQDVLSIQGNGSLLSENLSQTLQRFQNHDFLDDEDEAMLEWFNKLYEFRQRHALRAALRGARIPDIIIGRNHGSGEISLVSEEDNWSYRFDMDDFCLHLRHMLHEFLLRWSTMSQFTASRARSSSLLTLI